MALIEKRVKLYLMYITYKFFFVVQFLHNKEKASYLDSYMGIY